MVHKTTLPIFNAMHPSRDSARVQQAVRSVVVEYLPNETFTLSFNAESGSDTTTALFQRVIAKLQALNRSTALPIDIAAIVSLETKNKNLHADFLLSLEDKPLNFLLDGTVLVPYYSKATSSTSSVQVAAGLEDYEFLAAVGKGGFATVYLARMKQTGKFFAIKQIKKKKLSSRDERNLLQERNSMIEVNSPFVARLYTAFQTKDYCYLVMEYMPGGDLLSYFENKTRLSEEVAKFYVAEIALGLNSLHEKKILYRDLKPENVLTDLDGHAVLSDFGLSKKQKADELNYSICGTPHFIAPEVYKKSGYTHMADYFALGALTFEIVTGRLPFEAGDVRTLAKKIVGESHRLPAANTSEFQDFVAGLLEKNPAKRLGAQNGINDILSHPWFKSIDIKALAAKKLAAPKLTKKQAKELESLPAGFCPERPNINVLEGLNQAPKTEESQRIAMFSYYSSEPKARSDNLNSCGLWETEMGETDEADGKSQKSVSEYVFRYNPKLNKKIFA